MSSGRLAHPRRRLNPAFRAAVRAAMLSGRPATLLAGLAGFPNASLFSTLLHARRVPATPLTVTRFERVADLITVRRDLIFLEEPEGEP